MKGILGQLSALRHQAFDVQRFEDVASGLLSLSNSDWSTLGADLLRVFGVR